MTPVAPPPDPAGRRAGPSDSPHGRLLVPATLGIRHFSPASARALSLLLEALQPDCILLEAPVDAAGRLRDLGATGTRPPVGLVGVPSPLDGDRFLYPLAPESPEWVAVRWAHERGCLLEGIDLPGAALLALERTTASQSPHDAPVDPYAAFAAAAGAEDFDGWWERRFEQGSHPETYAEAIWALALGLREQPWPEALKREWLMRETFMRRRIREVLDRGVSAERCLVVCGAIHAPALTHDRPTSFPLESGSAPVAGPPSGAAQHLPPTAATGPMAQLTWFPTILSTGRMHSASRMGVVRPPFAYLQLLAEAQREGRPAAVAPAFLSRVAGVLRASGASISPAEVIDAVRLAEQLASMEGAHVVTIRDLRDAAMTRFGAGAASSEVAAAIDLAAEGVGVGHLEGSRPLLAHELERRLEALKLPRLRPGLHHTLELDLRPLPGSIAVERSTLLHRLRALSVPGIVLRDPSDSGARSAWLERWELRGLPSLDAALSEAGLLGDSIAAAVEARLSVRLEQTPTLTGLARVLVDARACALPQLLDRTAERLGQLDLESPPFAELVEAARMVRLDGSWRASATAANASPEGALLDVLFAAAIRRLPLLPEPDHTEARDVMALRTLLGESIATGLRLEDLRVQLKGLATGLRDRPRLRGAALALSLEQALIPLPELSTLLSTRLGGVRIRETAAFLEGLLADPRALHGSPLPGALDAWVRSADSVAFSRALVPLRRAFARWDEEARATLRAATETLASGSASTKPEADASGAQLHPPDGPLARALERLDDLEL
ncbi:MAG TPA: DUF5682 family protein [Myxococcaceae bacterium]|nr:DUF5682 family protein [Myxococcaceae bacterium]